MPIINKKIHTNPEDIKKRLKIILKSYKKMNAATIRQLKCIGFIVKKAESTAGYTGKGSRENVTSFPPRPVTEKPEPTQQPS